MGEAKALVRVGRRQVKSSDHWLLVVGATEQLLNMAEGEESWWCVDIGSKTGDLALVYRPASPHIEGAVVCSFEVVTLRVRQRSFCRLYGMATARIKMLRVFDPPISRRKVLENPAVKNESFARRNFQGKSFPISPEVFAATASLAEP
jgi:hypothetical protein